MYTSLKYGTIIKELRKDRRMSQEDLARDICSQGMLSRIENNDVVPNVLVMQKLCQRLNVSVNYVLTLEDGPEQPRNYWLELLKKFKQNKDFDQLAETVEQLVAVDDVFVSKSEQQEFAYYYSSSLAYHQNNWSKALEILQGGIKLTYYRGKQDISDIEVMLFSDIGKVYYSQGKYDKGITYMKKSISYFYSDIPNRKRIELVKIFYNVASGLIDLESYEEALEYIEQGILWSQHKKTYYRLADLYYLKGIVLQAQNLLGEADKAVEIAMMLEKITIQVEKIN